MMPLQRAEDSIVQPIVTRNSMAQREINRECNRDRDNDAKEVTKKKERKRMKPTER